MEDFGKFRKLKEVHVEIIRKFQENPKASNSEIGKEIGLSGSAVDNHMTDIYDAMKIKGGVGEKKKKLIQIITQPAETTTTKKTTLDDIYGHRKREKPTTTSPPPTEPPKVETPPPPPPDRSLPQSSPRPPPGWNRRIREIDLEPPEPVRAPRERHGIRDPLLIVVLTLFFAFVVHLAVRGRNNVIESQPTPSRPETPAVTTSHQTLPSNATFTATPAPTITATPKPTSTKMKVKKKPTATPTVKKKKNKVKHPTDTPTLVPTPYTPPYP